MSRLLVRTRCGETAVLPGGEAAYGLGGRERITRAQAAVVAGWLRHTSGRHWLILALQAALIAAMHLVDPRPDLP